MSLPTDYYRQNVRKYFAPPPPVPTYRPMTTAQPVAPLQPAAQVQTEEPQEKKKGTVDKLFGGLGSVASAAGDILDLSGKYVARPLLGAGAKLMASEEVQGVANALGTGMSEEDAEKIRNAESLTAAWRAKADQKGVDWWEEMIAEVVADPTTWITAGGVGAIRAVPWVARAADNSPKVAQALQKAENAAGLAERVQALPLTAPFAAIRGASKALPNKGTGVFDPVSGEELMKGPLQESPRSVLNQRSVQMQEALRTAVHEGAVTRGTSPVGQFGFSSKSGIDSLYGSNRVVDASRTKEELQGIGPIHEPTVMAELSRMSSESLNDVYRTLSNSDPLTKLVEAEMAARGFIDTARPVLQKNFKKTPQGTFVQGAPTLGPATFDWNQQALDADIAQETLLRNTPGASGAVPKMVGDTTQDVKSMLRFVKHDAGLGADTALPIEPFIERNLATVIERNKGRVDAGALFAHNEVRADLAKAVAAPTEREAARHLETAFYRINAKQSARGVMHPWGAGIVDKYIPMIDKTKDNINIPAVNRYAIHNSVVNDDQMRAMEKMYSDGNVLSKQKAWEKDGNKMSEIFNRTPGTGSFGDSITIQDIKDNYYLFSPEDQKWIDDYRKQWKIDDASFEGTQSRASKLSKTAGMRDIKTYKISDAYIDNMLETWEKSTSEIMGISSKSSDQAFFGKFAWVPRAWREQALFSPRYQFLNGLDMAVKSILHGVNGFQNRGADDTAKKLGLSVPREVFVGGMTRDIGDIGQEFASPSGSSVLPGPLGWLSRMNRGVARGMENSFREWAWDNGMKDVLQEYKPMLHNQIRTMNPMKADAIIADLEGKGTWSTIGGKRVNTKRDAGILFSADDLHQIARKHGATTQQANDLSRQWQGVVQQGSQRGIEMSNKVHFDFDKTYNIEDKLFLKQIMPFHFFATRNIPGYAQTLANRPEVVNAWMAYQDASEQDRIDIGLPDRFKGMVPIGDGFLNGLLGPNQVYFNPMSAISIVDQTKNFGMATRENEYAEPAKLLSRRGIGTLLDRSAKLGIGGPAPWIQIPLSIVGVTERGAKDETMPLLRHSGLAEATLGTDLGEGAARGFFDEARAAFHQGERVETHTGSQFRDNQIVTKLQEMMQTEIDKGNDPTKTRNLFVQASKDGPGNAVWDEAAEKVHNEQGQRDARNFLFPLPTKDTTEQGLRLHQARESKPEGLLDNDTVVELLKHFGDPAVANRGFRRPSLVDRQGDPIFIDRNTGKRETEADRQSAKDAWGGEHWGPDKSYPYNSDAIYNLWQQYKSGLGDPSKARVSDFFKLYKIPGR